MNEKKFKSSFESHEGWVSQVKFNPTLDHVFLSAGYDGTVKLWDLRNEDKPLSTLKRKASSPDYKVFAAEWNGAS